MLKEKARKQEALCRCGAQSSCDVDNRHQVLVGLVDAKEVIDVRLDAFGHRGFQLVASNRFFSSASSFLKAIWRQRSASCPVMMI